MITKKDWEAFNNYRKIQSKIEDHITLALQEIFKIYGSELITWYYPGADEGGMGEMRIFGNQIHIETEYNIGKLEYTAQYEDEEWGGSFTGEFPIHFLFLSIDEIKEKVSTFKKNFEAEKERKRKKKQQQAKKRKQKKDKLAATAKEKLTKEELKALGL